MVLAGIVAIIFPVISSEVLILGLGWLLIISSIVQGVSVFYERSSSPDSR
ncbi:MAG: DUF308 domain-containing protein [Hyphomicrobium sp.]